MDDKIFYNKTLYLTSKMLFEDCRYDGNCKKSNYEEICGPCWWERISVKPVDSIKECTECLKDMVAFKEKLNNPKIIVIEIESKCCIWCIWFDWFDFKRRSMANGAKKELKYIWNYDRNKTVKTIQPVGSKK